MIVRLLRTVHRGQEEAGRIIYEDGELRVEDTPRPEQLLNAIFLGPVPEDPKAIEAALLDMPRRWDGSRLRAQVVMGEGSAKSGWYGPPKGTHGPGSQGGKVTDDQFGSQIAMDANETAIVIYDGKESFRQGGNEVSVIFSADQRGQLKDTKIIHNHPDGSTLSGGDLAFAAQEDLAEVQAVSHIDEKTFRRDRFVRGPGGWKDRDAIGFMVSLRGNQLQDKYNERIADGTLSREEAKETFWPELYELIDDEMGFDFIEEVGRYD